MAGGENLKKGVELNCYNFRTQELEVPEFPNSIEFN